MNAEPGSTNPEASLDAGDAAVSQWLSRVLLWTVAIVALALTYVAVTTVHEQSLARDRVRFDTAVNSRLSAILDRVTACSNILRGVAARVTSARLPITRDSFKNYVQGLDLEHQYPGIQGIGYARRIARGTEEQLVTRMHQEGIPNFHIWTDPTNTETLEDLYPIIYLEPEDRRNRAVLGFDMYTELARREAMERAFRAGQPTASGRVILKQEIEPAKQPGLLLYCPVFATGPYADPAGRAALQGFAYCALRATDLIHGVLGVEPRSPVYVQVYDGRATNPASLLYRSHGELPHLESQSHEVTIDVAGRPWTLLFNSTDEFDHGSSRNEAWYVLITGLGVSLVLFLLTRAEARARKAAERSNTYLRENRTRLQILNEELAKARDQALEASRAKSAFLANMSHELRTPLNAIIGYAELLHEELPEQGFDNQRSDLNKVRSAAKHLLELVSEILDLAKIEAGRLEVTVERVQLEELLNDSVTVVEPAIYANGNSIRIECEQAGSIVTDGMRLRQVLINLVGNAAKFTERGSIVLRCGRYTPSDAGERVRIDVIDTGIGIAPDQLARLFENFQQVDSSSTRKHGGTGLGLAISRRIARALGGDIIATSKPGQGSTFTVDIPAVVNPAQVRTLQGSDESSLAVHSA